MWAHYNVHIYLLALLSTVPTLSVFIELIWPIIFNLDLSFAVALNVIAFGFDRWLDAEQIEDSCVPQLASWLMSTARRLPLQTDLLCVFIHPLEDIVLDVWREIPKRDQYKFTPSFLARTLALFVFLLASKFDVKSSWWRIIARLVNMRNCATRHSAVNVDGTAFAFLFLLWKDITAWNNMLTDIHLAS